MQKKTKNEIIAANRERLNKINEPYNPVTGEGSNSVKRIKIEIKGSPISKMFLPVQFANTQFVKQLLLLGFDGFIKQILNTGVSEEVRQELWKEFIKERIKYDFEFWAFMFIIIRAKGKGKEINFKLNRAQRYYLCELEKLRMTGVAIDIILCKARQWGGSTLTQIYMLWIQLVHRRNWNSVICGDVDSQSRTVSGMITKALKEYPAWLSNGTKIKSLPFEGSQKTRMIDYSQSVYSLGSAQKPDSLRSQDILMAHLTEVGIWKATKGKKPEDIVQSIFGSILSVPYSVRVLESTAKGVGNFFHREWLAATSTDPKTKSNFTPVFVPWFMIDLYSEPIKNYLVFIEEMDEYEHHLFELGATLEAINWYRKKSKDMRDTWRMCSEFPSTAREAFQSSGRRVFKMGYVDQARKSCIKPWFYGDIVSDSDSGKGAFKNIRFIELHREEEKETPEDCLWVWLMPDNSISYRNRYVVIVDVGGTSDKADWSDILVLDRLPMLEGGVPEMAAEWHGHIEHDKLAWKSAQIAEAYCHALLVIESNTLETEGTEGDNFEYILNEIADHYDNLYSRTSEQQIKKGMPQRWGFHTNSSTKPMVIGHMIKCLRDGLYIEYCMEATFEMDVFELKEDGKTMGAVEGMNDDRVMTRAIGIWVCYNHALPVKRQANTGYNRKTKVVSEASI